MRDRLERIGIVLLVPILIPLMLAWAMATAVLWMVVWVVDIALLPVWFIMWLWAGKFQGLQLEDRINKATGIFDHMYE